MRLAVFFVAAALLFGFGFHAMWQGGWFGTPIMALVLVLVATTLIDRRRRAGR